MGNIMEAHYTLPGVMHFLRTEWQQRERARIEWEIERADLRSRISKLEAEKHELACERDVAKRHLELLIAQLKHNNGQQTGAQVHEEHLENAQTSVSGTERQSSRHAETEKAQTVSSGLLTTVSESRSYLTQCIADIRHILRGCGVMVNDTEPVMAHRSGTGVVQEFTTLANFGTTALSTLVLPDNRITAGTVDGDLLIWAEGATEPRKFGKDLDPVNCLRYRDGQLVAISGAQILVYKLVENELPQLETRTIAPGEVPIVHVAVAPQGPWLATVQADGQAAIWNMKDGNEVVNTSQPAGGVRTCEFAVMHDGEESRLHLVLARAADSLGPDGPDGNLLLADPTTGRLLKKIVITSSASICAIYLTPETIVLGTESGALRVLGLARGDTIANVAAAHRGEITSLTWLGNSDVLISTSIDGRVSLWSMPSLMWKGRLLSHDSGYGALCCSSNSQCTAVGGGDGIIRVYQNPRQP